MEMNEKKQEHVNSNAITEVNSSIILVAALLVICSEVITKRQKPKRFAAVLKICWEVLLAIRAKIPMGLYISMLKSDNGLRGQDPSRETCLVLK